MDAPNATAPTAANAAAICESSGQRTTSGLKNCGAAKGLAVTPMRVSWPRRKGAQSVYAELSSNRRALALTPLRLSSERSEGSSVTGTSPPSARYSLPRFQPSSSAQQSTEKALYAT